RVDYIAIEAIAELITVAVVDEGLHLCGGRLGQHAGRKCAGCKREELRQAKAGAIAGLEIGAGSKLLVGADQAKGSAPEPVGIALAGRHEAYAPDTHERFDA